MLENLSLVGSGGSGSDDDPGDGDGPLLLNLLPDSVVEARGCHLEVIGSSSSPAPPAVHVAEGALLRLADDRSVEVEQEQEQEQEQQEEQEQRIIGGDTPAGGGDAGGEEQPRLRLSGWRGDGAVVVERGGQAQAGSAALRRVAEAPPTDLGATTAALEETLGGALATPNAGAGAGTGTGTGSGSGSGGLGASPNGGSNSDPHPRRRPLSQRLIAWWPFRSYIPPARGRREGEAEAETETETEEGGFGSREEWRLDLHASGGGGGGGGGGVSDLGQGRSLRGFGSKTAPASPAVVRDGGGGGSAGRRAAHMSLVEGAAAAGGGFGGNHSGSRGGVNSHRGSRGLLVECPEGYFGEG